MEQLRFLTREQAEEVRRRFGTPAYVYHEDTLRRQAEAALRFPHAFGLTVRYAMKASPNAAILRLFDTLGLHIDASSGFEVSRALRAGIDPTRISLSSQEFPGEFAEFARSGVRINACSISQLTRFGQAFRGGSVGLRVNPGLGSGGTSKTNVGGPSSSFGVWHEKLEQVKEAARKFDLRIVRIHSHIGSGSDPAVWQHVADLTLGMVREFPDVATVNLGGGYKVGRMSRERTTDLEEIGTPVRAAFEAFAEETGRRLHLEIEPGTFLAANACALISTIQDMTDTGSNGFRFLKLDAGMTEILRPALYGAQHPIVVLPSNPTRNTVAYVVVGHCCESGDLLTPAPDHPDALQPRDLAEAALGDLCVIEGAGAYCAAMSARNYNSFPAAPEIMLTGSGKLELIRRRQTLEEILQTEV